MTNSIDLQHYRAKLRSSVPQVDDIFAGCMAEAKAVMSENGIDAYLEAASIISNLGRGTELVLIFLQGAPSIAKVVGEDSLHEIAWMCQLLSRTALGKAINPFLATLPTVTRRLERAKLLREYFLLLERMTEEGSEGVIPLFNQVEFLLSQINIGGLKNWVNYGLRVYRTQTYKMGDYFSLQSPDSRAALQRERHGTLFVDHERRLYMYTKSFWKVDTDLHPYSTGFATLRKPIPYLDKEGFHLPDLLDDSNGVRGIDRYRAVLAHLAAHQAYTKPFIADNYNRYQHMFIETFEDSRVEALAIQRFPGLRQLFMALHPIPEEGACPADHSPIRHKAAMLSRALLDADHPYQDPILLDFVQQFHARMAQDPHDTKLSIDLGIQYLVKHHNPSFRSPKVWFKDTEIGYRDDNRYMWIFLEDTDDENDFHSDHSAANPRERGEEELIMFARHHPEWDYQSQSYRPDWATVYETPYQMGSASVVDNLLEKNKLIAKRLKRIIDMLKPQQHVRVRYQEDGSELDLDVAIRSMVDYKSGANPDPRIHMSTKTDGRDIAVTLLLDLSESINQVPEGSTSSIRDLSQEAVSLLAWAIDELGDPLAIAGFASNTRHEVRFLHFKGFNEPWGDDVKGRLGALEGGHSTRMGAAIRHAGHYLSRRNNDKKLLLILTDGEPADIDVQDPQYLRHDTKKAVDELRAKGVSSYCISLDANADDYVGEIFGNAYTVIDHMDKLPEQLPKLFMALTK